MSETSPSASPFRRRMGTAAVIVSAGILLSRILGQVREIIFAGLLGADAVTDQYVAAFRIPDFLNYLLAGGFLSITFIPILSRYLAADDEEGGWAAFSAVFRVVAAGIVVLVAVGWIVAPAVIEAIFPEFTDDQVATTVRLTRIVLPAQVFFVLGALFSAVQYAKGLFVVPSIAPVVYNLGIIAGGVGQAVVTGAPDPEGFIWGALAGALVGNFALQWWGARRAGLRGLGARPEGAGRPWRHPAFAEYVAIAFPLMIGQSIVVLDETFMSVFGDLVGDGAQTQLLYARRTMFVPVGIIAQAAGVAAYPYLARLFAEGRDVALAQTVDRAMRYVVVLSLGAAALLAALSVPVVEVLFERGSFEPADTVQSATALFFYAFAVPVWGMLSILTRAFYARREMWTPVVIGTVATVAALPIYWGLQRWFGIAGVATASTISLAGYTTALALRWYRGSAGRRRLVAVMEVAGRAVPLIVPAALVASGVSIALGGIGAGFPGAVLQLVSGVMAFAAVVFGLGALLHDRLSSLPASSDSDGDVAGPGTR